MGIDRCWLVVEIDIGNVVGKGVALLLGLPDASLISRGDDGSDYAEEPQALQKCLTDSQLLIVLYVVFKLDESYTPSKVSILAGDGFHNLKPALCIERGLFLILWQKVHIAEKGFKYTLNDL
ncbi:hypothetical protein JHK87_009741 [Glycine soja]|nr:hypothetical protein JHK87_009741 [Glycine soja]